MYNSVVGYCNKKEQQQRTNGEQTERRKVNPRIIYMCSPAFSAEQRDIRDYMIIFYWLSITIKTNLLSIIFRAKKIIIFDFDANLDIANQHVGKL